MDYATELRNILPLSFTDNEPKITCMTNLLVELPKAGTNNMHKIVYHMPESTKPQTKYR